MKQHPVSGYMIVRNEVRSIEASARCLLGYCDDVLVVDGGSTDGTLEKLLALRREFDKLRVIIWTQRGSKYHPKWKEPDRRNWAAQACLHDWVLTIDGDELLDDVTEDYFRNLKNPVRFIRHNLLTRREIILRWHTANGWESWYPDYQVRYFNRTRCRYTDHPLHCYLIDENNQPIWPGVERSSVEMFHYHALVHPDRKWDNPGMRVFLEIDVLRKPLPEFDKLILAQSQ